MYGRIDIRPLPQKRFIPYEPFFLKYLSKTIENIMLIILHFEPLYIKKVPCYFKIKGL